APAMRRFGLKPAARRLAMRRVESVLQLDREVGGLAVRVGLAGGRFGDRRAVELGELDQVLFLLPLGRLFERLFDRAAHVDRTLDLASRSPPRHQAITPTVAGSPSSNATSPRGNTGPSRHTRALPWAVTTTHARQTPIAQPMCCSTAICASRSGARPGAAGPRSACSRSRPMAASIGHGPHAQSWSAHSSSGVSASVTRPFTPNEPSSVVVTYSTAAGRRSLGQR